MEMNTVCGVAQLAPDGIGLTALLLAMVVLVVPAGAWGQAAGSGSPDDAVLAVTAQVDLGKDVGQNFGSLFEARDGDGRVVCGAGFLGLYNTYYRADRLTVQFFIRPPDDGDAFTKKVLPRPGPDCGAYLFDLDGRVYAYSHVTDRTVRSWDESAGSWKVDPNPVPQRMRLGKGLLQFSDGAVYNGRTILTKPEKGRYYGFYYAQGRLFFYHTHKAEPGGFTRLYACPWSPDTGQPADPGRAAVLSVQFVGETPFVWGQLGRRVLTVSNMGGVYVFDGGDWRTLRAPVKGVSYQVYSALNYHDRLLLGQYPTGELFEFDGEKVERLEGWPPRIKGVSPNAREAQTTVIYRGDLLVGVWPWAELWRYHQQEKRWISMGRMFTHPPVTDRTTHPYEREATAAGVVLNQWGQRITSMLPSGAGLMISTSAKWPCKWEPDKFGFLAADEKWKEYGNVIRLTLPGNLAAPIQWTGRPTRLGFIVKRGEMAIVQDGRRLATARLDAALTPNPKSCRITWGQGVFGPFQGTFITKSPQ